MEQYLSIIKENCSHDDFNHLMITMESDKGKLSVVQDTLKKVLQNLIGKISDLMKTEKGKEFDEIAKSNGDITKVKGFDTTMKVLDALGKDKRADIKNDVAEIKKLITYVKGKKNQWLKVQNKGRKADSLVDQLVAKTLYWAYCGCVRLCIVGTSITAARAMEIVPAKKDTEVMKNIKKMNEMFQTGRVDKGINALLDDKVTESIALLVTVASIVAIITLALSIRIFVYYFYYSRVKMADYFAQQSDFLTIHESELKKNSSMGAAEKNSIIDAQKAWAKRFMNLSEFIMVDDLKVEKEVKKEVVKANRELAPSNNVIDVPNTGMDFF